MLEGRAARDLSPFRKPHVAFMFGVVDLIDLPVGSVARIRAVSAESTAALRLREMGVRPGSLVRLAGRGASNSRILVMGASRLAVDAATAAHIEVEPA